uniref:Uncharacterized protein LOC105033109 isoform X1 n=1 Tax=Elaeis guineensis var. tenera TaxID=51953 RepID=A0A6I9QBH7_ELAGV|nr:uncharacterized protein LOC105033109 isoform X1 [Elaeis guineensis]
MNIQPGIVLELQLVQNLLSVYNNILCQVTHATLLICTNGPCLCLSHYFPFFVIILQGNVIGAYCCPQPFLWPHRERIISMVQASLHVQESHLNEILDCSFNYWVPIVNPFSSLSRRNDQGKETGNAYCFLIIQQVETTGNSIKDEQLDIIRSTQNARTEV